MPRIKEILRRHERKYLESFGDAMPAWHRNALRSVIACRTPAMGSHVRGCADCGTLETVHNSCRSRACPDCHGERTVKWLAARSAEILPVRHFHVVFTVPAGLRKALRRHQKKLLGAMMAAAAGAVAAVAADPRWLGGLAAIMAVLHTAGRNLSWHPHVHCLVPAVAVGPGGELLEPSSPKFLLPVKALAKLFRQRLAKLARAAAPDIELPWRLFGPKEKWHVHSTPCLAGPGAVVEYLGAYLFRPPIGDARILKATADEVVFKFRDSETGLTRTERVSPIEFMRRILQHVPPPGLHRVRYFGLWGPAARRKMRRVRLLLAATHPKEAEAVGMAEEKAAKAFDDLARRKALCAKCGSTRLMVVAWIKPNEHGPPVAA